MDWELSVCGVWGLYGSGFRVLVIRTMLSDHRAHIDLQLEVGDHIASTVLG